MKVRILPVMAKKSIKAKNLELCLLGDPTIRKVALEVASIKDKDIQALIKELIATVKKVNGVGIAAPQVGKSLRLFIVASTPTARYPQAPKMVPLAVINPKVIFASQTMVKGWEGCLSIPGIRGLIPRHDSITIEYADKSGKKVLKTYTGFVAKIFQHELDHLDGKVFLDRLETVKDIISEKEYMKQMKSHVMLNKEKDNI